MQTKSIVHSLEGHTHNVCAVLFHPKLPIIASASEDGTVRIWDARPWTPELRADREALSFIQFLKHQGHNPDEWGQIISLDETISPAARQRALQFAE